MLLTNIFVFMQETIATTEETASDLESVEQQQKKFEEFQRDLKTNEARLMEMNTIAETLESLGQADAADKVRAQVQTLNERWTALEQITSEKTESLMSSHEVQRYHR
jgi:spectrin alpha